MTVICKHCAQEHDEIGLLACFESQVKRWREERDQIKAWGMGLEQKLESATRCNCPGPCNAQGCLLKEIERLRGGIDKFGLTVVQLGNKLRAAELQIYDFSTGLGRMSLWASAHSLNALSPSYCSR